MSVSEFLFWSGPVQALIISIFGILCLVAVLVFIWALDIRGKGISHQ